MGIPFSGQMWRLKEMRPLTTDERASFAILALYMVLFGVCSFIFWESLQLRIAGSVGAVCGIFLFVATFFNTEARGRGDSLHPVRSYLVSFFIVLCILFLIRWLGGYAADTAYGIWILALGTIFTLIVFRKAMVQVTTTVLAGVFIFVTVNNWDDVLSGEMKFEDVLRQSGTAIFETATIKEVTHMLIASNYMGYLNRIDYRDPQINIMATRAVADAKDDDLNKTRAILDMVSNEIHYVSDPDDGSEHAKDPIITLISGGGDCEDQTLLLCSLLETVGVKSYIVFTGDHVFALVRFNRRYPDLLAAPHVYIDGDPCYALDPADPGAVIGQSSANPKDICRIFDVRSKTMTRFERYSGT